VSVLLASLGTSIANVALPSLARAFGAPLQQVQWVVLAYLLAITTLVVSAGRLGDLLGRRRLLLAGIGLFTAASWLCALAPTLGWLIAARALQGAGAALMMALGMAMVGGVVPKSRSGSAMGWLGTMSAVGTALGARARRSAARRLWLDRSVRAAGAAGSAGAVAGLALPAAGCPRRHARREPHSTHRAHSCWR
jgi:MFS family permease